MSTLQVANHLLKETNMNIHNFEEHVKPLNEEPDDDKESIKVLNFKKWRVVFQSGTRNKKEIIELLRIVERYCSRFRDLCYGTLWIMKDMKRERQAPKNAPAMYVTKKDGILLTTSPNGIVQIDKHLVFYFLHELGHRLIAKALASSSDYDWVTRKEKVDEIADNPGVYKNFSGELSARGAAYGTVKNANFHIDNSGFLTWHNGTFKDGVWYVGAWKGGLFKGDRWNGDTWEGGTFDGGDWHGGIWEGGEWLNGTWRRGYDKDGKLHHTYDPPDRW